ncbi:MAG: tetratricopeptide repeat protein, partial [Chthonomonadales bacterium]
MDPRERENLLIEANLLCTRGKFEQAQKLLEQIRHAFPGDNDAWYLLERIRATKEIEKDHDYRMRTARHTLGMHTSFNRL